MTGAWEPHRPPWYPDRGPFHNPFAMNGQEGAAADTNYGDWVKTLAPGELERLIAEHAEARP